MTVKKRISLLFSFSLVAILFSSLLSAAEENVYKVGVIPQFETRQIRAIWRPILDEIESRTGLRFVLTDSETIPVFEQELISGMFDFAYINPYEVTLASGNTTYIPLLRDVGKNLYGIIVVPKNSAIQNVKELDKKILAFPSPNALGATLLVRSELKDKHGVNVIPRYVQTHSSVFLNVVLDETVAGGAVQKTLGQQDADIRESLRVLYETQSVASHPIVANERVPGPVREKVRQAMMKLSETESGQALLSQIPIEKLGQAEVSDYLPLTKMGLDRFHSR